MFAKLTHWWARHAQRRKEKGQGLVEYALILVLVSITVIALLSFLGTSINQIFEDVADTLQGNTVTVLEARYFPVANKIDIRAHYRGTYDPNVTLMISRDGGAPQAMARWNTWDAQPNLVPTYGRSYANANTLGCPCTFTITDPNGNEKTVTVNVP